MPLRTEPGSEFGELQCCSQTRGWHLTILPEHLALAGSGYEVRTLMISKAARAAATDTLRLSTPPVIGTEAIT